MNNIEQWVHIALEGIIAAGGLVGTYILKTVKAAVAEHQLKISKELAELRLSITKDLSDLRSATSKDIAELSNANAKDISELQISLVKSTGAMDRSLSEASVNLERNLKSHLDATYMPKSEVVVRISTESARVDDLTERVRTIEHRA